MYAVRLEENAHPSDESARWTLGEFEDFRAAVSAAQNVVEEDLNALHRTGMTVEELFRYYTLFGHDAFIVPDIPDRRFSAWDYARRRCGEICGGSPETDMEKGHG